MFSSNSLSSVSQQTGASQEEVVSVLSSVLPQMLNGANAQANNQATAASFANALNSHAQTNTDDLTAFFNKVDADDGAKIVGHLLGDDNKAVTQAASKKSGVSPLKTAAIMAVAAPLLMSLMGKQTQQAQQQTPTASVSSLMGSLLGGGVQQQSQQTGLLGSLLGGGMQQPQQSSGIDLGDILGSLLK